MNWFDLESRAKLSVTKVGLYRHVHHRDTTILGGWWNIGDDWHEYRGAFADGVDPDLKDEVYPTPVLDSIENGDEWAAHNAAYDRELWNAVARREGLPEFRPGQLVCTMSWAAAFNLPQGLGALSKLLLPPDEAKLVDMSEGIKYMWSADHPLLSPEDMDMQMDYCQRDVEAMRRCMDYLPPMTDDFKRQYHASEAVNARGVFLDQDLIGAVNTLEPQVKAALAADIARAAGRALNPKSPKQMLAWFEENLPEDMLDCLMMAEKKRDPKTLGFRTSKRKSTSKPVRKAILDKMGDRTDMQNVREVIAAIDEASRATISKFATAASMSDDDGAIRGQLVFNGASATGRFSSRGLQIHNLKRLVADNAQEIIKMLIRYKDAPEALEQWLGAGINEAISSILRPMFVAADGRVLVWCDWSSIEARVLAWLANDPRAQPLIDLFANGGDVYVAQASDIYGAAPEDIDKEMRQSGKVAILSLGYQGGVNAFQSMARNYGVTMEDKQADMIKRNWRNANPWAVDFWARLERAAFNAIHKPGEMIPVGRVAYQFRPELLGGSLLCWLPSGRWLTYPRAHIRQIEKFEGEVFEPAVVFAHPKYGWSALYGGLQAENVTQAVAADLLREALVECEDQGIETVMHCHDEICAEADLADAEAVKHQMERVMKTVPQWAVGLPIDCEAEIGIRYKCPVGVVLDSVA